MSDEQWSGRNPKRARGSGEEEKTAKEPAPAGGRPPAGEEEGRYRGQYPPDYPGMYPPPPGEGQPYVHPMHPYPPAGQWSYPPPPQYGMYPPYPPGYPPPPYPPSQGMPPPYYSEHPPGHPPGASMYPERAPRGLGDAPPTRARRESKDEDYEEDETGKMPSDTSSASRARLYVKSKVPTRQEILDRRARKNAQSRARAAKLRERIEYIQTKPDSERTDEEREIFGQFQYRRKRKNDRSRERAIEKKTEIDRILSKSEKKRTKIERDFLDTALHAKQRKNQGDRLRRQRIKHMKMAARGVVGDESLGVASHRVSSVGFGTGMSEIPMSPLPPSGPGHPSMASPAALASPGLMPNIAFPSPPNARRPPGAPGSVEAPRGAQGQAESAAGSRVPLPFVPPDQSFGSADSPAARSQLHMPQPSSSVEQRRNPDGSMSISIGRKASGGAASSEGQGEAEEPPPAASSNAGSNVNLSDVSQLLLYGENGAEQEGASEEKREATEPDADAT